MRRLAALVLATSLLAPASALAGKVKEPCKGVSLKTNKFGTTRTFEAGDLKIRQTDKGTMIELALKVGGGYGWAVSGTAEQLPAGTEVELLFEDGSKMLLTTGNSVGTRVVSIMGAVVSYFDLPIPLTDEQAREIGGKALSAWRIPSRDNYEPAEAKSGDAKKWAEALTCIIDNPLPAAE